METSGMVFNVIPTLLYRASFPVVSVIYLWVVVYRYLRFKSAETKRINEGDYAAIPSYVKLIWTWRKHSAYHAGIGASASGMEMRDANIRGWLALSCSFAHYPGISLCSRGVRFVFHLAQPKIITRITSRTRDFRYI